MNAWKVCCGSCEHTGNLAGNWSDYERQTLESRPCPRCGAYTLKCPEPLRVKPKLLRVRINARGQKFAG